MAIQANKPNSRIFLLLGVVLAAAAAVAVLLLVRSNAPANEVSVVVSDTSIPAGTTLTPAMVQVAQVPLTAKPGDAYTDPVAVVGKVTQVALANNTPLVPGFFSTPALSITSSGTGSAAVSVETQITKGYVALAIPTNASVPTSLTTLQQNNFSGPLVSDAFYILPGDHIDMLVQSTNGTQGLRYTFQDLIVLRVGNAGTTTTGAADVLLVEVPRAEAPLLSGLVVGDGHEFIVKYVLRPESEWGKLTATGYTPNYEPAGTISVPSVKQTIVTPSTLDSLFGG
ncbi:MAG TPA: SAF domain-containing protein [Candidatus Dormibacteraeota bacterium]|nr:SAF domain-containing protein [Candidatus Dormibacteraeota bacterium]